MEIWLNPLLERNCFLDGDRTKLWRVQGFSANPKGEPWALIECEDGRVFACPFSRLTMKDPDGALRNV